MSRYNTRTQRWVKKLLPGNMKEKYQQQIDQNLLLNWERGGRPLPPPHIVKVRTVENFQKETAYQTLVETGTFMGDMIIAQINNFNLIYSIELSEDLWKNARILFDGNAKVKLLQGDSGEVLKELVPKLTEPAIFWLDGHYSGGITAKGDKVCPIYEELEAIFQSQHKHCLLIDDSRLFVGEDDYPTIDELKAFILAKKPTANIEIKDDTICVLY